MRSVLDGLAWRAAAVCAAACWNAQSCSGRTSGPDSRRGSDVQRPEMCIRDSCINSGLRRVYILTQYKALSLNRHIREGWTGIVAQELGEFIEILPPMQRVSANWYMGTADAVYQNIYSIGAEQPKHVLILSGDHIYKMNYGLMLDHHKNAGADVTLATLPIDPADVARFGAVEVNRTGEVIGLSLIHI